MRVSKNRGVPDCPSFFSYKKHFFPLPYVFHARRQSVFALAVSPPFFSPALVPVLGHSECAFTSGACSAAALVGLHPSWDHVEDCLVSQNTGMGSRHTGIHRKGGEGNMDMHLWVHPSSSNRTSSIRTHSDLHNARSATMLDMRRRVAVVCTKNDCKQCEGTPRVRANTMEIAGDGAVARNSIHPRRAATSIQARKDAVWARRIHVHSYPPIHAREGTHVTTDADGPYCCMQEVRLWSFTLQTWWCTGLYVCVRRHLVVHRSAVARALCMRVDVCVDPVLNICP